MLIIIKILTVILLTVTVSFVGGAAQISMRLDFIAEPDSLGLYRCVAQNPLTLQNKTSDEAEVDVIRKSVK